MVDDSTLSDDTLSTGADFGDEEISGDLDSDELEDFDDFSDELKDWN